MDPITMIALGLGSSQAIGSVSNIIRNIQEGKMARTQMQMALKQSKKEKEANRMMMNMLEALKQQDVELMTERMPEIQRESALFEALLGKAFGGPSFKEMNAERSFQAGVQGLQGAMAPPPPLPVPGISLANLTRIT